MSRAISALTAMCVMFLVTAAPASAVVDAIQHSDTDEIRTYVWNPYGCDWPDGGEDVAWTMHVRSASIQRVRPSGDATWKTTWFYSGSGVGLESGDRYTYTSQSVDQQKYSASGDLLLENWSGSGTTTGPDGRILSHLRFSVHTGADRAASFVIMPDQCTPGSVQLIMEGPNSMIISK